MVNAQSVIFGIILVGTIHCSAQASTEEYLLNTGNGLLAACTYQGDVLSEVEYHFGTCVGFIKGVINGVEIMRLAEGKQPLYCVRPNIDNGQIRDVVVKALREHPEDRDEASGPAVMGAMYKAFGCKKH